MGIELLFSGLDFQSLACINIECDLHLYFLSLCSLYRQLVTSDMTFSFFTGDLLILFAAHKAASFGIFGEACRATGSSAVPMQYGVVTYKHGWLNIAADVLFFDRIILYHTFYKQVLDMCLTKNALLKSPASLTFRFHGSFLN